MTTPTATYPLVSPAITAAVGAPVDADRDVLGAAVLRLTPYPVTPATTRLAGWVAVCVDECTLEGKLPQPECLNTYALDLPDVDSQRDTTEEDRLVTFAVELDRRAVEAAAATDDDFTGVCEDVVRKRADLIARALLAKLDPTRCPF